MLTFIMVGATGLNTFERLLIGSSSEYILRHAKVDLLIVRDSEKNTLVTSHKAPLVLFSYEKEPRSKSQFFFLF